MGIENVSVIFAKLLFCPVFDRQQLASRQTNCCPKTVQLAVQFGFIDVGSVNIARALVHAQYFTYDYPLRNTQPFPTNLWSFRHYPCPCDALRQIAKTITKQFVQRFYRFLLIAALSNGPQLRSATGRQHQNVENGFRISAGTVIHSLQPQTAVKPARYPNDFCCGSRM